MACDDEKKLEVFEKENDNLSWTRHIIDTIIYIAAVVLAVNFVNESV